MKKKFLLLSFLLLPSILFAEVPHEGPVITIVNHMQQHGNVPAGCITFQPQVTYDDLRGVVTAWPEYAIVDERQIDWRVFRDIQIQSYEIRGMIGAENIEPLPSCRKLVKALSEKQDITMTAERVIYEGRPRLRCHYQ